MEVCEKYKGGMKEAESSKPKESQESTHRAADDLSLAGAEVCQVDPQVGVRLSRNGVKYSPSKQNSSEMRLKVKIEFEHVRELREIKLEESTR